MVVAMEMRILVWLVPSLMVALAIRYVIGDRDGEPDRTAHGLPALDGGNPGIDDDGQVG